MRNINERPVCHRAEDLVTYLYGEASADEAQDFTEHLQQCDACRVEFTMFNQVHHSIVSWRNQALGMSTAPNTSPAMQPVSTTAPVMTPQRKLSAGAAIRQFFSVSPLWLRGATAAVMMLLCVLMVIAVSRFWQRPAAVVKSGDQPVFDGPKFDQAVRKQVDEELARQKEVTASRTNDNSGATISLPRVANRDRSRNQRRKGLSQDERVQLAADLGLISGPDEGPSFVFPEEPNQ